MTDAFSAWESLLGDAMVLWCYFLRVMV